jgi:hypothetical protein
MAHGGLVIHPGRTTQRDAPIIGRARAEDQLSLFACQQVWQAQGAEHRPSGREIGKKHDLTSAFEPVIKQRTAENGARSACEASDPACAFIATLREIVAAAHAKHR